MRNFLFGRCLLLVLFVGFFTGQTVWAGNKYRIGYLQGGDYHTYRQLFQAVVNELKSVGWFDKLEFPPDACLSAEWNREKCREMANALAVRKDLDMIWAFGSTSTILI